MNGYIKLHRSLLKNPVVMKDTDHLAVWIYLLLNATFTDETSIIFGGKRMYLRPGDIVTGRRKISVELDINESKVQRILKEFEDNEMIEQRSDRQKRVISMLNWSEYQKSEQRVNNGFRRISEVSDANPTKNEQRNEQRVNNGITCGTTVSDISQTKNEQRNEQRVNNDRTTTEQRVNTNKECKERKKDNNVQECIDKSSSAMKKVYRYREQIGRRNL